jgi:hypothetical protein
MSTTVSPAAKPPVYRRLPLDNEGNLVQSADAFLKSPRSMVIISFPKTGKTDNMVNVPKILIGDCEGGTAYFKANNVVSLTRVIPDATGKLPAPYMITKTGAFIPTPLYEVVQELRKVNHMSKFEALYDQLEQDRSPDTYKALVELINQMKFPVFVIDTLTHFKNMVDGAALAEFNYFVTDPNKIKADIRKADNYGGAKHIRSALENIKNFIEKNAAPFIIYNGHIKMKKSVLKKTDEEISTVDLALEGALPTIFTAHAPAIAICVRNDKGVFLDFQKRDETDLDARPRHLGGKIIKIADLHQTDENGDIADAEGNLFGKGETYWNQIFPEVDFS